MAKGSASIFSLMGSIFIDTEKANKSIEDTTNKGKNFGEKVGGALSKVSDVAIGLGTAVVAGTTAAVGGLMAMADKTASTADTFDKASLRTGLQVEELQRLNYAAGQSGVSMSSLENSAKKLNTRLGEVSEGNKSATEMFEKLGISVKDSNGNMRDATDIYNDTLLALADMGDTAEATAIGTDIFGKSFTDLKPLLASGSAGINELKNRADELGIVMSEDAVKAGVTFGDTLADIKQSLSGSFNTIMGSLIPVMQKVLDLIIDNMPMIQGIISTLAPVLGDLLETALPPLLELAESILPVLVELINELLPFITQVVESILPVIVELLQMILPPLMQIIQMILPLIISLIQPLLQLLQPLLSLLQPILDLVMALITPLVEILNMILPPLITLFTSLIDVAIKPLQTALEMIVGFITNSFVAAFNMIKLQIDNIINVFKGIITFITGVFTGDWSKAWEGIKSIFESIVNTFIGIFKTPLNWIIDGINVFIRGLNAIKIPDWVPGIGGASLNLKEFNRLRIGIDEVPYDEYPTLLHKGERVLTASENKEYKEIVNNQTVNKENQNQYHYTINVNVDKMEVRDKKDIENIAEELFYLLKKKEA